ncbi:Retrotransposon-derived protein peg10, partial [Ascosphaera aggregata]
DEKKVYRQREAQLNTTINNLRQQLNEALNEVDHSERIIQERESSIIQLKTRLRETSVATNASTSTPIAARPLEYKHTKFDGQAKNLSRFVNRLENDFCLFAANFPTEQTKVAYAMSGLGEQPDDWAQQFFEVDDGVRHSWTAFKERLLKNYEDPDLLANTQRELFELRQGNNLITYINRFENLCARVRWPLTAWASTFLNRLQPGLQRKIR